jgi:hypothetical protein
MSGRNLLFFRESALKALKMFISLRERAWVREALDSV